MRSNSIGVESHVGQNRLYTSIPNKSLALSNNSNKYYNVKVIHQPNNFEDFNDVQRPQESHGSESPRRSRQPNMCDGRIIHGNKFLVKRDNSMPPISAKELQCSDDNVLSQYLFKTNQYSIDGDSENIFDDHNTDMYDSIITSVSITPPPVHMIHEYTNNKAIIRPLAFKPVQKNVRSRHLSESSPTKPPMILKNKGGQAKQISPPPIPPHTGRVSLKSSLGKLQSLKSGDSSGYYSSRTVGTTNGNTSSTDISPIFDDNGSMIDSITTGDVYVNTTDLINNYPLNDEHQQENFRSIRPSLEAEIATERERNRALETALLKSSAKLSNAESQINELKMRLSKTFSEVNITKENLALCKRSLEHQSKKTHNLEVSIQSIHNERVKETFTKEKATQTYAYHGEYATNNLLDQFEEERRTWLDEKLKVLTYQKQIETNFQKLLIKSRSLECQLVQLRSSVKKCRSQPSNQCEDTEKWSHHSADSSTRAFVINTSRTEQAAHHQSSL